MPSLSTGCFNCSTVSNELKLDIYPRELIPGELDRSVPQEVFEDEVLPVASCADVGLSKLIWMNSLDGSARHSQYDSASPIEVAEYRT